MSIFKPTMAITRFKVSGIPEVDGKDVIEHILDSLNAFKITDMDIGEEVTWGWTSIFNSYKPDFNVSTFMTGDYVTIGLRVDKKSIPTKALNREIYYAEEAFLLEHQIPKIARAQKVLIKQTVVANLLKTAPVVPTSYDIVWNVGEQIMYLFSTQKLAREIVEDMMLESFDLGVTMVFPFTMALNDFEEDVLAANAQPTSFI